MLKLANMFNFDTVISPVHVAADMDRHFGMDKNSKIARRNPVLSL